MMGWGLICPERSEEQARGVRTFFASSSPRAASSSASFLRKLLYGKNEQAEAT